MRKSYLNLINIVPNVILINILLRQKWCWKIILLLITFDSENLNSFPSIESTMDVRSITFWYYLLVKWELELTQLELNDHRNGKFIV